MKTLAVEKKESLFKRIMNKISNSALFSIIVDSSAGTYNVEETKTDEYSDAFKKAYANQAKGAESLSTLEEPEYKEEINPWRTKINETSELTSSTLTKGKAGRKPGKKPKTEEREIND